MANQEHLHILQQGAAAWNQWRKEHVDVWPNFSDADLHGMDLHDANLRNSNFFRVDLHETDLCRANLHRANLFGSNLSKGYLADANLFRANLHAADLSEADLFKADLSEADLYGANLFRADLHEANLRKTYLKRANLSEANLNDADLKYALLRGAALVQTSLHRANLTGAAIYGISAWNLQVEDTLQSNLVITDDGEPTITVDNLEVAQFIYLLLNNPKIRDVIDTIAKKVVLILGRFTLERKVLLDGLREELRHHDYLPVVFDFEKPGSKDLTETISTLAHLSKFIIIDLTDPSSAPHEAATIIPHCIVPVQPLLLQGDLRYEYAMFRDLQQRYHWVLPTYRYQDTSELLKLLQEYVITPAEEKLKELTQRKQDP